MFNQLVFGRFPSKKSIRRLVNRMHFDKTLFTVSNFLDLLASALVGGSSGLSLGCGPRGFEP
jgi:hypothetical protein